MTKIEWTETTWNPIVGCSHASLGCHNCYAERMANRLSKNPITVDKYGPVIGPDGKWNGKTNFIESELDKPRKWKKPRMIFVCSMADLFHPANPFEWIERVFSKMIMYDWHTFQVLTKRPERFMQFLEWYWKDDGYIKKNMPMLPGNIWVGVSTENQEQANNRIPVLLEIPAKVRFISAEPLIGRVDLTSIRGNAGSYYQVLTPIRNCGDSNRPALDWVIAGHETGPRKRSMKTEWLQSLADQCKKYDIAFFDKKNVLGKNIQQYPNND